MSKTYQPHFIQSHPFTYQNLKNDLSQDQVPNYNQKISTSDISNQFSDQNCVGFQHKSSPNSDKKPCINPHKAQKTHSISKNPKEERIKSYQHQNSNKFSFILKLLLCIFSLILIGGVLLTKLEDDFKRKPETNDFRRDMKKVLYKIYIESQNVQSQKDEAHLGQNDAIQKMTIKSENSLLGNDNQGVEKQSTLQETKLELQEVKQTELRIEEQQRSTLSLENEFEQIKINKQKTAQNNYQNNSEKNAQSSQTSLNPKAKKQNVITQTPQISINSAQIPSFQLNSETSKQTIAQTIIQPSQIAETRNWKKPRHQDQFQNPKRPQPQIENEATKYMTCQDYLLYQRTKFGKLYTFIPARQYFRSNSAADYFPDNPAIKITNQKYTEAVDLLDVVHKVDYQGNIQVQDTPCETKDAASKRINQTIQKQLKRLNETYQIESYHKNQLRFCIITNSYRNAESGLLYRNIDSILQQNYTNYHVVYTDDASPDKTGEIVKDYLKEKGVEEGKFKVKINSEKKGMMENIFNAITNDCELGEIVVMLDGDDSFIGTNVLSLLNAVYQKEKVAMMWNNFLQITKNSRAIIGFSRDYLNEEQIIENRRTLRFVSSHLKSFYVDVFRQIKVEDLQYKNGIFYGGASDTAMMLAMIEMSNPKFLYIPEITYEYRFDTGQVGMVINRVEQKIALSKISQSQPYQPLQEFSFINEAIKKAQNV